MSSNQVNVLVTGGTPHLRTVVSGALKEDLERRKFTDVTCKNLPMSMLDAVSELLGAPEAFATPVVIEQYSLTTAEDYEGASDAVSNLMETMYEADVAPKTPPRTTTQIQEDRLRQIRLENELFGKLYAEQGDAMVLDAANDILRKSGQTQRLVSFTTTDGATYGPVEA